MSTYEQLRDREYSSRLDRAIEAFAHQYKRDTKSKRKTVILFPGGAASQLMRSRNPRNRPPRVYGTAWLEFSALCGAFTDLAFKSGGLIDKDERYIVPNGAVDFFPSIQPYASFERWCIRNWIHLFVFGWDWRRSMQDAATFFLKEFMPKFEAEFSRYRPHPLDDFTLIGHSAGGMVVKIICNDETDPYVCRMGNAITVATPFYGYGGQIHRFIVGDPDINRTVPPPNPNSKVVRYISGMPAGYEFLYLDYKTYLANKKAFAKDPDGFNLNAYPSMDSTIGTEVADPYNPSSDSKGLVRYPTRFGFSHRMLGEGLKTSHLVSRSLESSVQAKFFNIRGVRTRSHKPLNSTVVSQIWKRVRKSFDPDVHGDPIKDRMGPGDGVQPAWTTRLLGLPRKHVITVLGNIDHANMMNEGRVQSQIARLMGVTGATFLPAEKEAPVASRAELNKFLDEMWPLVRKERSLIRDVEKLDREFLHSLLARAYVDALKSPSQKLKSRRRKK